MKQYLMLFMMMSPFFLLAQKKKDFAKCSSLGTFSVYAKDTIIVSCDTAYILSKPAFNTLFQPVRNQNELQKAKEIIKTQNEYIVELDIQLTRKNKEYTGLKAKFDSVSFSSLNIANSVGERLQSVNDSLSIVHMKIGEAKKSIDEAAKFIQTERNTSFLKKLGWGISGFGIGLVTTLLIVLAD